MIISNVTLLGIRKNPWLARRIQQLRNNTTSYQRAVNALYKYKDIDMFGDIPYGILFKETMQQFLHGLDVDEKDLNKMNAVHVTGTNGKGSTCAFVEGILQRHGVKTGFISSPHLVEVRERIRIDGKTISRQLFADYFWEVDKRLKASASQRTVPFPDFYNFITAMSFYVFKHENVDAAVLEVSIGGAYDITNVVPRPTVCGVSSIGVDHIKLLGNSVDSIAWHKAGIFKPGSPAFTVRQPIDAVKILHDVALKKNVPLTVVPNLANFDNQTGKVRLLLAGKHQELNASLAVHLANQWLRTHLGLGAGLGLDHIGEKHKDALENCELNGRSQVIKFDTTTFYLDGAHTMRSVMCAKTWFEKEAKQEEAHLRKVCERVLVFNITLQRNAFNHLALLQSCNFSRAAFVSNVIFDTNQAEWLENQQDEQDLIDRNKDAWLELQRMAEPQHMPEDSISTHESIEAFVVSISKGRDRSLMGKISGDANHQRPNKSSRHLQVLVTGSLKLVGGFLTILQAGN